MRDGDLARDDAEVGVWGQARVQLRPDASQRRVGDARDKGGGGPQRVHAAFDGLQVVAVESGVDDDRRKALGLVQAVGEGLAVAVLDELGGVRAVGQDEGAGDACLVVGQ